MLSIVSTLSSSVPWLAVNEHAPEAVSWDWNAVGTVSLVTDGSRSLGRSDAATQKISSPQFVVAHAGHRPGGAGRAPLFPQMKDAGI
jgi:hypothetical protein